MGTTIILSIVAILVTAAICFTVIVVRIVENAGDKASARMADAQRHADKMSELLTLTETLNKNLSEENSQLKKSVYELKKKLKERYAKENA